MKAKFEKFHESLSSVYGEYLVEFVVLNDDTCCVRSFRTSMFVSHVLRKLIGLCDSLDLHFYVRSNTLENRVDCVEFVVF